MVSLLLRKCYIVSHKWPDILPIWPPSMFAFSFLHLALALCTPALSDTVVMYTAWARVGSTNVLFHPINTTTKAKSPSGVSKQQVIPSSLTAPLHILSQYISFISSMCWAASLWKLLLDLEDWCLMPFCLLFPYPESQRSCCMLRMCWGQAFKW